MMRFGRMADNIWLQFLVLFFGILCIAWSAIFVKLAGISGVGSAFYRMFIGTIAIFPLYLKRGNHSIDPKSIKIAALCGVFFACDLAMWNTSIMISKAAISTLLANLAPVWVGLGAIFILKEKPKLIFWIGTAIAIFGVMVIIGIDKVYQTKLTKGHFLAICASLLYAAYLLTTQKIRNSLDTISFTFVSMLVSSGVLLIISLYMGVPLRGFSFHSWMSLVGLGLISQLGGWLAINYALGYIKSTVASVSLLSQSVFTAIISMPVLGEYLSWPEISGAIIVLIGIFMVNRVGFNRKTEIEPEFD